MNRHLWAGLFLSSTLIACVDAPDLGEEASGISPGSGGRENGRWFLGDTADVFIGPNGNADFIAGSSTGVTIAGVGVTVAIVESQAAGPCLSINGQPCSATAANGAIFLGPSSSVPRLKIESTTQFTGPLGQPMTGYVVKHNAAWAIGGTSWVTYCKSDRLAYPVSGRISRSGHFGPTGDVSFGCSEYTAAGIKPTALADLTGNGLAAKVMSWGFLRVGTFSNLAGIQIDGESLYEVAVSAGRADYCLDAGSHTIDGTSIELVDLVPGNLATDAVGGMVPSPAASTTPVESIAGQYHLEALWSGKNVQCLSKLRWQGLPVGDRCTAAGGTLRDPRLPYDMVAGDPPTWVPHGKFCEDYPTDLSSLAGGGTMLAVDSTWNDVGLWHWKHATNGDHYTTTVGSYNGAHVGGSTLPEAGYSTSPVPMLYGTIVTTIGRDILRANYGADAGTFVALKSCKKNSDWLTTAPAVFALPSGYTACKVEGHIWATPPSPDVLTKLGWTMVTLKLFKKNSEYFTTTASAVAGYTLVAPLGSIVAPPTW
ncbi:MAG: hypothetical protein IPL61_17400 [Myxococcales bacterium]|nr:hypothetical protein [Myxococcales bacterium]